MRRKLNAISTVTLLAALVIAGAGTQLANAAPAGQGQTGAQSWVVLNGAQAFTEPGEKATWQMLKFYPETITVNAGDSITWRHNSAAEPHTVTFYGPETTRVEEIIPEGPPPPNGPPVLVGNPLVFFPQGGTSYDGTAFTNSGVMADDIPGPKEYMLTFPKAGTYQYICNLHAFQLPDGSFVGMKATVVVQDAGAALTKTPAQVDTEAAAAIETDRQAAAAKEAEITAGMVKAARPGPNGGMIYPVNVGYTVETPSVMDYQRFFPKNINISVGDTVEWSMPTAGFHTVTFGEEPPLFTIEPQQAGPPRVVINPLFFPAGSNIHTGTGYYNSGPLGGPDDPPEAGPKTYSLTFTQEGRYEYICMPHYANGMTATVTVAARTGGAPQPEPGTGTGTGTGTGGVTQPPGMPRTGAGGDWQLLALFAGLLLATAGVVLRRRNTREHAS